MERREEMSELSFINKYGNARPDQRADIILDHFQDFPSIIERQKKILVYQIKNERKYVQQKKRDRQVRVSLPGSISDPTAKEAIEQVYIEELLSEGEDIGELLQGMEAEEKSLLYRQFHILRKMQEEYTILETQLMLMNSNQKRIFLLYIESGHDFRTIADEEGIRYDSARRRIWEIRKWIKARVASSMAEHI